MSLQKLPEITHLQFLVLEGLEAGEQPGRVLRELLAGYGVRNSAPAFYQMMARLEQAGLVEGRYDHKALNGQRVKERCYEITRAGQRAFEATRAFYLDRNAASRVARRGSGV